MIILSALLYWLSLIPFPYYSGIIYISLSIDNGSILFQLLIWILFPVIYWMNGYESKTIKSCIIFILSSLLLFLTFTLTSLLLFFICYECLIIVLTLLLFLLIPSYYRIRTAFFFFLFSLYGSAWFIISVILFLSSSFGLILFLIIPFLIKMPCFHFIIDYLKFIVKQTLQYHYY